MMNTHQQTDPSQKFTHVVRARATSSLFQHVKLAAEAENLGVGEFIRRAVNERIRCVMANRAARDGNAAERPV